MQELDGDLNSGHPCLPPRRWCPMGFLSMAAGLRGEVRRAAIPLTTP